MDAIKKGLKFYLGIALFVYSFIPSVLSWILVFSGISFGELFTFIVVFVVSGQIAFIISIVLLGKTVIQIIKSKFYDYFKLNCFNRDSYYISYRRHLCGIILLIISFIPYLITEVSLLFGYPVEYLESSFLFYILLGGDITFIVSLFVLGSGFWERLKNLFKWHQKPVEYIDKKKII